VPARHLFLSEEGTYSATISPPDAAAFQQTGSYLNTWRRGPDGGMRIVSSIVEPDAAQP
jgi:hypothetical protein